MFFFILFLAGVALFYVFLYFPYTAGMACILSAARLISRGRVLLVIPFMLGGLYAWFRYSPPLDTVAAGREIRIHCVANDSPHELPSRRLMNEVTIQSAFDADRGDPLAFLNNREMSIISDNGLKRGLRYDLTVRPVGDKERRNPGSVQNDTLYAYLQEVNSAEPFGESPLIAWFKDRRDMLTQYLKGNFQGDSAALLASITTGERSAMSEELKDAFNATGLVHLLSISGTHFGLFSMLIFALFRFLIRYLPHRILQRITIYLTPSQIAALASLPFMLMYLFISGASIPAVRSFIMINVFLLGLLIGRKGFWLNSLLFAAFLICVWDPSAILTISFQLSFLAVFSIGYAFGEREQKPGKEGVSGLVTGYLKNSLILTLAASLGTAPLVAYYFHYFSVISPLANLLITPFIGLVLVALSLIAAFSYLFAGYYPFQPLVALATDISIKGVKVFASIPFADVRIPAFPPVLIILFYAGMMVYCLSGKKRYICVLFLASLIICSAFLVKGLVKGKDAISVTYLDVGQGDSAVVEAQGGMIMVIDTGRTGRELDAYLRYLGKRNIDVLLVTHADDDHAAGAPSVMRKFVVKEVWDNGLLIYPDEFLSKVTHRSLERGDATKAYGLDILILHPYEGFYTFADSEAATENNDSLVVKITGRNKSFLFTADVAEEAEEDLVHLGKWLKSDVLKVSHHGSRTSSSEDFLRIAAPEIAVISVGRDNSYGHPHRETIERLQGIRVYRTDQDGAVKITETPGGLAVKTYRDFPLERTRSAGGELRNIRRLFMEW
ncbi:MAG TPA: DNA internalization-related competence protein ComEC/Rec2 [Thermodesulfovibrionales bacterium]|nr:DNA internalization-related competence protein ComEC/Rec2 [Thermodesulfovibrionales bacterium]